MSKHTPGPWVISPNRRRRLSDFQKTIEHGMSVTIMTGNGHRTAIVDGPSNIEKQTEFEANARLIALAPTMYQGLRDAVDFIWAEMRENPDKEDMDGSIMDRLIDLQTDLLDILRKVEP